MKIAGRIIQTRNITHNDEHTFSGYYKNHSIYVTDDHGHGKSKDIQLTRYHIEVTDPRGCYACNSWEDLEDINAAIIYALDGAVL
ncbi:hypothetical protein TH53_19870 [Pedobacter lusitanus]|uniref:Uncharacterized protein n=1 Tax=Pedobacter lusitanus TaxID=1503925 RepID=A0A0D0F1U6_9SPHI|nr:hypothetical protein [Pedobacter lusitanus]KIO75598.1 hypothetical protein TH53_19870 [Pedobacter lusitanus]